MKFLHLTTTLNQRDSKSSSEIGAGDFPFDFKYEKLSESTAFKDSFKLIGIERKNETFNRVIFDLMIYYFSEEKNRNFVEEKAINLREKFVELMSTDLDFQDSMTQNTHQTSKVEYRFKKFREFLGL